MLKVRKAPTSNGATEVQVVFYKNREPRVVKHIGSGRSKEEINSLYNQGHAWIAKKNWQLELFTEEESNTQHDLQFLGVLHISLLTKF